MPHPDPMPVTSDQIERVVAALRATKSNLSDLLGEVGARTIAEISPQRYMRGIVLASAKARIPST
jgi:hypothetical protein